MACDVACVRPLVGCPSMQRVLCCPVSRACLPYLAGCHAPPLQFNTTANISISDYLIGVSSNSTYTGAANYTSLRFRAIAGNYTLSITATAASREVYGDAGLTVLVQVRVCVWRGGAALLPCLSLLLVHRSPCLAAPAERFRAARARRVASTAHLLCGGRQWRPHSTSLCNTQCAKECKRPEGACIMP